MPITDFPSDGETTCSLSGGNFRMASTALTERPLVFKIIETSKVLLTMKVPEDGLRESEAPSPCLSPSSFSCARARKSALPSGEKSTKSATKMIVSFLATIFLLYHLPRTKTSIALFEFPLGACDKRSFSDGVNVVGL